MFSRFCQVTHSPTRTAFWKPMDMNKFLHAYHHQQARGPGINGVAHADQDPDQVKAYRDTLKKLIEFENNAAVLRRVNPRNIEESRMKQKLLIELLSLFNVSLEDLNKLNVIHIAGTKGKGSTCAYIERILLERGYKTGLYTSPHLVSVRERIRLSGHPITRESFIHYFWKVQSKISDCPEKPGFFMFMTLLSFIVFLEQKVDVAILETGIGGEVDSTNIVPRPIVTGITSLGIDHTMTLGDTIESIAWHKAGILKPNVTCYSSPQPAAALKVITNRSVERNCPLFTCPPLESYSTQTGRRIVNLGIDGSVQKLNASLALQICRYFHYAMKRPRDGSLENVSTAQKLDSDGFVLDESEIRGLEKTKWMGRCGLITKGPVNYFLDGAHTVESLDNCLKWFNVKSPQVYPHEKGKVFKVLLFYSAGLRQFEPLIERVARETFDWAIFPFNEIDSPENYPELMIDFRHDPDLLSERITRTKEMWSKIQQENHREHKNCSQFSSLTQTLSHLESDEFRSAHNISPERQLHILVTGSLLFVGNVITILDPNLTCLSIDT